MIFEWTRFLLIVTAFDIVLSRHSWHLFNCEMKRVKSWWMWEEKTVFLFERTFYRIIISLCLSFEHHGFDIFQYNGQEPCLLIAILTKRGTIAFFDWQVRFSMVVNMFIILDYYVEHLEMGKTESGNNQITNRNERSKICCFKMNKYIK